MSDDNRVITALIMPRGPYEEICKIVREHGGVNCSVFTFMNVENPPITFLGLPIIVSE